MRTRKKPTIKKFCRFCVNKDMAIDYKDIGMVRKFISSYGKITPRRRNGLCAAHQRNMSLAIKRARIMALIPFLID